MRLILSEPPELLDANLRAKCEGFKLAYADFLLRCGLLGIRAALLQYRFVESETSDKIIKSASGHLPLPIQQRRRYETQAISRVCIACAAGSEHCVACQQTPTKPVCAYCRLPIRGEHYYCCRSLGPDSPTDRRPRCNMCQLRAPLARQVLPRPFLRQHERHVSFLSVPLCRGGWDDWSYDCIPRTGLVCRSDFGPQQEHGAGHRHPALAARCSGDETYDLRLFASH